MSLLFLVILVYTTLVWTFFLKRVNFATAILTGYCLTLVSAIPLILLERWSLSHHTGVLGILALYPTYRLGITFHSFKHLFSAVKWNRGWLFFALTMGLAFFTQRHSIHYLYSTHDPSSYLNAAYHLKRTGSLIPRNELSRLAYGDGHTLLKPILNLEETPEPWMNVRNFGVLPLDLVSGKGTFHGFFATPIFLAIGMELFGEENATYIQWVHCLAIAALLLALAQFFSPQVALPWLMPLAYVLCPLVPLLFRLPLSEPLASVFFLGMCYSSLFLSETFGNPRYLFLFALVGSLCTRISGLVYVPFFVATLVFIKPPRIYVLLSTLAVTATLAITSYLNPSYSSDILIHYIDYLFTLVHFPIPLEKFTFLHALGSVLFLSLGVGLLVYALRFLRHEKVWRTVWGSFCAVTLAGLVFRYYKLLTALSDHVGGFPFTVSFLDSLVFYVGPVVVLLGTLYWWGQFAKRLKPSIVFLQMTVPFCVFFYCVLMFGTLALQVYLQRYLLTELIPFSLLGALLFFAAKPVVGWRRPLAIATVTSVLFCDVGLIAALNKNDICEKTYGSYQHLKELIFAHAGRGKKPVLVSIRPTWRQMAYLMPVSHAFGVPVTFVNREPTSEDLLAIRELAALNYDPILVKANPPEGPGPMVKTSVGNWRYAWNWADCHSYSSFRREGPPAELVETCESLNFYSPDMPTHHNL